MEKLNISRDTFLAVPEVARGEEAAQEEGPKSEKAVVEEAVDEVE